MTSACPVTTDVERAAQIIRDGGLVAFATETVYGLGANAFDPIAVARIFEVKQRPQFDPLIVHVPNVDWLDQLASDTPEVAKRLADLFWPGPLTLVLPKLPSVPDLVTSGLPTVGIRVPNHPIALELLRAARLPIAAPSANPFGRLSPTRAEHVLEFLGDHIDLILDGGDCEVGVESTVLQVGKDQPVLLRPGGVSTEQIESAIGPISTVEEKSNPSSKSFESPGMLPSHYAPHTPLVLVDELTDLPDVERIGLLTLRPVGDSSRFERIEVLSPEGSLTEAAARFFVALHRLDRFQLDLIVAITVPEEGIGRALNDRLRRASYTSSR